MYNSRGIVQDEGTSAACGGFQVCSGMLRVVAFSSNLVAPTRAYRGGGAGGVGLCAFARLCCPSGVSSGVGS